MSEPRLVEVRRNVLKQNDIIARALREQFRAAGVFVVSLVSSPGSGKTMFLEKTLTQLQPRYRVAALVGDLATENDAVRLARSKAPVKQITTGTLCHLEAAMVQNALQEWDLHQLDFLFIENVGNLVCPSSYDLGENLRLAVRRSGPPPRAPPHLGPPADGQPVPPLPRRGRARTRAGHRSRPIAGRHPQYRRARTCHVRRAAGRER